MATGFPPRAHPVAGRLPAPHETFHVPALAITLAGAACGVAIAFGGVNALYLCLAAIGGALVLYDFRVGVVALVLLMPVSGSSLFPHALFGITGLNPLNVLLAATFGSYLLRALFDGGIRRFLPPPLLWLYVAPIVMAGVLGVRHVPDIVPGFFMYEMIEFHDAGGYLRDMVVKPLRLVLFALLVGAAVQRSAHPQRFLIPVLASIWLMGAIVVVFVFVRGASLGELAGTAARESLSPLGVHANELGRMYAVAYAMLLFAWAQSRHLVLKLALLASMALVVAALMLTFSRSAFVGVLVVNVLFLVWHRNARTLIFLALLLAVAALLLPAAVYDRMTTGFGSGLDAISAGRIEGLWLPLLADAVRSPLFGSGLGSIMWSEAMHSGGGSTVLGVTHPHNAYLEALLDMGVVGLALLGAYYFHAWKGLRALGADPGVEQVLRGLYQGAAAGLLCFLIAAVVDSSLVPKVEQTFLWLAIGMMYGQRGRKAAA